MKHLKADVGRITCCLYFVAVLSGPRHRTSSTYLTISNELSACEKYLFAVVVVGPLGTGPGPWSLRRGGFGGGVSSVGVSFAQATTLMDSLAPPKALRVDYYPTNESMVVISWNTSCPEFPMKESYLVTAFEETTNRTWVFQTPASDKGQSPISQLFINTN
jgi:hypothetical protein